MKKWPKNMVIGLAALTPAAAIIPVGISWYYGATALRSLDDIKPVEPTTTEQLPTATQDIIKKAQEAGPSASKTEVTNAINQCYWVTEQTTSNAVTNNTSLVENDIMTFLKAYMEDLTIFEQFLAKFPEIKRILIDYFEIPAELLNLTNMKAAARIYSMSYVFDQNTKTITIDGNIKASLTSSIYDSDTSEKIGNLGIEVEFDVHQLKYKMVSLNKENLLLDVDNWWCAAVVSDLTNDQTWSFTNNITINWTQNNKTYDPYYSSTLYNYTSELTPSSPIIDLLQWESTYLGNIDIFGSAQ